MFMSEAAGDYAGSFSLDFAVERHSVAVSMTILKFPRFVEFRTARRIKSSLISQVLGCLVI